MFVRVAHDDPLAAPLLAELATECENRYNGAADAIHTWSSSYPAAEFAEPDGGAGDRAAPPAEQI